MKLNDNDVQGQDFENCSKFRGAFRRQLFLKGQTLLINDDERTNYELCFLRAEVGPARKPESICNGISFNEAQQVMAV